MQEKLIDILSRATAWMTATQIADAGGWRSASNVTAALQQMEDALLWTLYHHQGGSSHIGQPIRKLLGIGQHDRLTDEQIAEAKAFGGAA